MSMAECTCDSGENEAAGTDMSSFLLLESGKTQQIDTGFYPSGSVLRNAVLTR